MPTRINLPVLVFLVIFIKICPCPESNNRHLYSNWKRKPLSINSLICPKAFLWKPNSIKCNTQSLILKQDGEKRNDLRVSLFLSLFPSRRDESTWYNRQRHRRDRVLFLKTSISGLGNEKHLRSNFVQLGLPPGRLKGDCRLLSGCGKEEIYQNSRAPNRRNAFLLAEVIADQIHRPTRGGQSIKFEKDSSIAT